MLVKEYLLKSDLHFYLEAASLIDQGALNHHNYTHIPILDKEKKLLGNISFDDLKTMQSSNALNLEKSSELFFVRLDELIFYALPLFKKHKTNVLPVINQKGVFKGIINTETVIQGFGQKLWIKDAAAFMLLEQNTEGYSALDLSRITEELNIRILGLWIYDYKSEILSIALALNKTFDVKLKNSLSRFGYRIVLDFFNNEEQGDLNSRYDQLMKILQE